MKPEIPINELIQILQEANSDNSSISFEDLEKLFIFKKTVASICDMIKTCVFYPKKMLKNKMMRSYSFESYIEAYIPNISLGRFKGHTTALAQFLSTETLPTDTLVIVCDGTQSSELKKKVTNGTILIKSIHTVSQAQLDDYPTIIFDGRFLLTELSRKKIDLTFLETANVVTVGV